MQVLEILNWVITGLFIFCYTYQFVFMPISLLYKNKKKMIHVTPKANSFTILISARNEEKVIGDLIDSIKNQTYTLGPIHPFVIADNCTDHTADVAREHGATVYTRFNKELIGKGYALDELLHHISEDFPEGFDGYMVFDADNILTSNYVEVMNQTFSDGYDVIVGYRNGKNYGDNWISAGYSLWFLRDSRYLNWPRFNLNTSCIVAGTGFMFSRSIAEELHGWPFHMLTEDTEFSAYLISSGRKIAYCKDAEFFDEQPTKFSQSWRQRMRWSRGSLQVFGRYGWKLTKGFFKYGFSCFDVIMSTMPAFILSCASIILNLIFTITAIIIGGDILSVLSSVWNFLSSLFGVVFIIGVFTTASEWKHIHTSPIKKILYTITFPLFMATYIPIAFCSLFFKPTWKPIEHKVTVSSLKGENEIIS